MKNLSNKLSQALVLAFGIALTALAIPATSDAASAYISPATGFIDKSTFKVSVYVESTTAEPEIASAQVKITFPSTVTATAVTEGEFDSYLDKTADAATRTISINAVSNAGNYKSGKVKLASLSFESTVNNGQVQLVVAPDSEINGAGGEQLLTETVNGVYTLDIKPAVGGTTATPTPTPTESTTGSSIKTGGNQIALYLAISLGLVALGVVSYTNPLSRKA